MTAAPALVSSPSRFRRFRTHRLAAPLGLALLGLAINSVVAWKTGRTTDEAAHLAYGDSILRGSAVRGDVFFNSKMPISALNSAPRMIGSLLEKRRLAPRLAAALKDIRAARMATVAAAFCLSFLVFLLAESLYGRMAALFAQVLLLLSPNITAHSTVATTDLYVTLAAVAFLYCLRRFLLSPGTSNALWLALVLGLAQLTKFSAMYLYLVLAVVLVSLMVFSKYRAASRDRISMRQVALLLSSCAVSFLLFVNAGFVFDRPFTPLARYEFMSPGFQALQRIPVVREIPLPLPHAYLDGFDLTSYDNAQAVTFGNLMLLGNLRGKEFPRSDGFTSYYVVAYALKEPIGMQILLVLGIISVIRRGRLADFFAAEWPLLVTAAVMLAVFSFFSNTQIGIRHILPVLAIFVIVSSAAFAGFFEASRRRQVVLGGCLLYVAVSVGSYFPQMIPYFNEIVFDRKMAYRYLGDSNLDWKQDRDIADAYVAAHPGVALDPPAPVTGWVLARANFIAGIEPKKADYWLRVRGLKPVAHVGYAHLLFWVPQ